MGKEIFRLKEINRTWGRQPYFDNTEFEKEFDSVERCDRQIKELYPEAKLIKDIYKIEGFRYLVVVKETEGEFGTKFETVDYYVFQYKD